MLQLYLCDSKVGVVPCNLGPSHPVISVSSVPGVTIPSYQNSANGNFTSVFYRLHSAVVDAGILKNSSRRR